jgi:hypothetical protein
MSKAVVVSSGPVRERYPYSSLIGNGATSSPVLYMTYWRGKLIELSEKSALLPIEFSHKDIMLQ